MTTAELIREANRGSLVRMVMRGSCPGSPYARTQLDVLVPVSGPCWARIGTRVRDAIDREMLKEVA